MTVEQAQVIINELRMQGRTEFDSHDFINRYRALYEDGYIEMLNTTHEHTINPNQTIHNLNIVIGRFLRVHERVLHIHGIMKDKVKSLNDHNNETGVQRWIFD